MSDGFNIGDMVTITDDLSYVFGCAGQVLMRDGDRYVVDMRRGTTAYTSVRHLAAMDTSRVWIGEVVQDVNGVVGVVAGTRKREGAVLVEFRGESEPRMVLVSDVKRLDVS